MRRLQSLSRKNLNLFIVKFMKKSKPNIIYMYIISGILFCQYFNIDKKSQNKKTKTILIYIIL